MKLASIKDGRDGRLVVVSSDLAKQVGASAIAPTLQKAIERWDEVSPDLQKLSQDLTSGKVAGEPFQPAHCASLLPRSFQWIDGSAYVNHVELVRKARGAQMPDSFWTDPLIYQGGSDSFLGPQDPIPLAGEEWGCDCEAEVAVIVDDVPMGIDAIHAREHIKLILLVNDVSLRNLIPSELAKGFGFFQSKPSSAFSPVAVTPDSLRSAWDGVKLHLPLVTKINGKVLGTPNAGVDMTFDFGQLIAHAAKTQRLSAGTIIGSGTVSNRGPDGTPGRSVSDGGVGYSFIAEVRTIETIQTGRAETSFLGYDDQVSIEMLDADGKSIFGCIDQVVSR